MTEHQNVLKILLSKGSMALKEKNRKKIPTLSFCITCKNRFSQIQKTLRQNLEDNRSYSSLIEFVLIDFGSTDGLREWIEDNFIEDIRKGYLCYFYTDQLHYWHASIAKNTAHRYAKNEILVNLDCDNFTGKEGGKYVIRQFLKYGKAIILHQFGGDLFDGTYGRIAMYRSLFYTIGGYDESFEPMGFQDIDLISRLCAMGLTYISSSDIRYCFALKNTKLDSIANTQSKLTWSEMELKNRKHSFANIKNGHLIANNGDFGIQNGIYELYVSLT